MSQDTIFALASGVGRSAVAIIRLSGPQVKTCLTGLIGMIPPPRRAVLKQLRSDDGPIDQALVLYFPGPHSFTGEDIAEFQVHGHVLRAHFDPSFEAKREFVQVGNHESDRAAQSLWIACRKMNLATAGIDPHVFQTGHDVRIARESEAGDIKQRTQHLIRHSHVDVFEPY